MRRNSDADLIDFPVSSTWAAHYDRLGDIDFAVSSAWADYYAVDPERLPPPVASPAPPNSKVYADRILALEERVFKKQQAERKPSKTIKGIELPKD